MKNTFKKYERLCRKSSIEYLYKKGNSIYLDSFSVKWVISPVPLPAPCQVLLVAPKKLFKHATERNKRKRLLKECFRLNKHEFYDFLQSHNMQILLGITYIQNKNMDWEELNILFNRIMSILMRDILKKANV